MRTVTLLMLLCSLMLVGCAGDQSALLQELRLDECEVGSVDIQGELSTGGVPWFGGSLIVNINEERTAETLPRRCLE